MAKLPTLLDFSLFGHLFIWDTLSLDYIPHWECSALTRRETRYEEDDFVLLGSRSWKQSLIQRNISDKDLFGSNNVKTNFLYQNQRKSLQKVFSADCFLVEDLQLAFFLNLD